MKNVVKVNMLKMYSIKILKILHFNDLLYKILRKIIKRKIVTCDDIKIEREKLNNIYKKPKGSACSHNNIVEKKVDLQIIVPCYNVEKYVKECIDSILAQETEYTYKVIIVDDGSTDKTPEIVDSYLNYSQVEIIHQKNKGLSGARNIALSTIYGEYVMFIDSDDKIPKDAVQSLLERAYDSGADIVDGGMINFNDKGVIHEDIGENLDDVNPYVSIKGISCGKIIRSKLFENIIFPLSFWFEDSITAFLLFPLAKSCATLGKVTYWYRRNTSGITFSARKNVKAIDTYWILEQMLQDEKKVGIKKDQRIYNQVLFQIYLNFSRTYCLNKEIKRSIFILSADILKNEFKGYVTENPKFRDLEKALREDDYTLYNLFCSLQ